MIDEQSEQEDEQSHKQAGHGQTILIVLLIVAVMVGGVLYTLRGEIFSSRPVLRVTPTIAPSPTIDARIAGLHLPAGFHISIFSAGLNTPRFMAFGPDGTLFVAERGTSSIIALLDPHRTGRATEKRVLINYLDDPTNLVYYQGALYVGEQMRISKFTLGPGLQVTSRQVIITNLPVGHPGDCKGVIAPLFKLQSHSAPLGLAFYNVGDFPLPYHGIFVALHGSFYTDFPAGYKVIFIPLDTRGHINGPPQDFITGWLVNNTISDATGRPVGLTVGPDGALYISDDKSGVIYRVTYAL